MLNKNINIIKFKNRKLIETAYKIFSLSLNIRIHEKRNLENSEKGKTINNFYFSQV